MMMREAAGPPVGVVAGQRHAEKRGANVEVYGFVGWIASGLIFGCPSPPNYFFFHPFLQYNILYSASFIYLYKIYIYILLVYLK